MLKKISLEIQWAFIFFLMMLGWMVLERWSGLHDTHLELHPYLTNLVAIPAILIYVLALIEIKKIKFAGNMSYIQAFYTGIIITIIIAILSPLSQYITSYWITPHYFNNVINYSVAHNLMTFDEAVSYFNFKSYVIQSIFGALIMGIITSAVVSLFVKTKKGIETIKNT
ncbi:MAG: hypothetical protein A2X64_01365 [Ignavibacteria bacterium GWF2_33_9]|nr:MAG: hypothetical protein A2X64_01365 [Ignavibacteria bacterium GWF2_33_9]